MDDKEMNERIIIEQAKKNGVDQHTLKPEKKYPADPEAASAISEVENIIQEKREQIIIPGDNVNNNDPELTKIGADAVHRAERIIAGMDITKNQSTQNPSEGNPLNAKSEHFVDPNPQELRKAGADALLEAERIINRSKYEIKKPLENIVIDFREPKHQTGIVKKLHSIITEINATHNKIIKERTELEPDGWEEEINVITKKRRPDLEEEQKYVFAIGRNAKGNLFYRVTEIKSGIAFDEKVIQQAELNETDYINRFLGKAEQRDPSNPKIILTNSDSPELISHTFIDLYNKANPKPSFLKRGVMWAKNKLQKKYPAE